MRALPPRLKALAGLIPPCGVLADVGCDHGLLAEYALERGLAQKAVLTDISAPSLQKAERLLAGRNAVFYVTDGLRGVKERIDAAVIAGMGGREILHILEEAGSLPYLLLQPMRDVPFLRARLNELGYAVQKDYIVESDGKFYVVLSCAPGGQRLTPLQLAFGKTNLESPSPAFFRYLAAEGERVKSLLERGVPEARAAELTGYLAQIEEILPCV